MRSRGELEEAADIRRREFLTTLETVQPRLTPAGLADEVIAQADPGTRLLRHIEASIRRNPGLAVAVLVGAWWLLGDAGRPPTEHVGVARHRRRTPRLARIEREGDYR